MRSDFRNLRLKQLDRALKPFRAARKTRRPLKGWLHAIRQAAGIPASEVAAAIGRSRSLPPQLERAEAQDRITLKSLRNAANALDCDLIYALVPRRGSLRDLIEHRARTQAKRRVLAVEHSMALEDQAAGRVNEAVKGETRRLVGKRGGR